MRWLRPVLVPSDTLTDLRALARASTDNTIAILRHLHRLKETLMTQLDTLQAAVDRNGSAVADAVVALLDQRQKIAALQAAVDSGQLDAGRLAAIAASIDASSDAVAQALAPVVADPDVPTGDVEVPADENPDTVAPQEVPGAVEAGQRLSDTA